VLNKFDKPWNSPTVTIAIRSFASGVTGPEVNVELEHIVTDSDSEAGRVAIIQ